MTSFKTFALLVLAATTIVPTLSAETHCPGNVASLPFRLVNRHQIIVPVSINHAGPFSFLLDTGTQMTMVDPALATALHMETTGNARVASVGMDSRASFAQADLLEAGSQSATNQKVLVYDLTNLQATDLNIQGVLGEDFLEHFDMLIDNGHSMLCLDDSAAMRTEVKGARIPLENQSAAGSELAGELLVVARLSDCMRPVRLKLDSGTNVPFLYNTSEYLAQGAFRGLSLRGGGANGAQRTFTALRPQTMKIGSVEVAAVSFITLAGAQKDSRTSQFDGLLTMGLFKRVFIDHADHFAVLEPF
jgi:hypothetical protein